MTNHDRRDEPEEGFLGFANYFRNGKRLQTALVMFVVMMGLVTIYNQLSTAFANSDLATHEYVNAAVQAEDNKLEMELGEIRSKSNDTTVSHAAELATQTTMNTETHDQLNTIETKVDTLNSQVGDIAVRMGKVETRLDDIAPRKRFNP